MKSRLVLLLLLAAPLFSLERPLYQEAFDPDVNGIFLPVKIGEESCNFLFDTGASFVVLDKRYKHLLGKRLSLKEAEARTGIHFEADTVLTPNGELSLEMYKAIPLKLGRLQISNRFPYIVADLRALWPFSGEKFCGILGTSFLHQFRWEINFEKGEIKAYIGVEPYMGEYDTRTPIAWSGGHIPQVEAGLGDTRLIFDIDLGDNGSGRVHKRNLMMLKRRKEVIRSQMQDVVTVSALSQSEEFRLRSLEFAGATYPELVMQVSKQNALGMAFFKRHNIVLDFPFHMLYLQHHKDYAVRQEVDKSGIRIVLRDGKLIVFSIKPLEGAEVEGLEEGDEILEVKGMKRAVLYEIRKALRGIEGEELFLKVRRKGEISRAKVTLGKDPL